MASLIPGYEYDIFISYRQKDNKHDGWITGFINHLKDELASTVKDEINIYYDINPRDGLLEMHDVDASLKDKLRCLIFIPIVSSIYCDPRSFAWENEFKAFVEMASRDQFGLKVKLLNGNVAGRILPVQIHELDPDDRVFLENELGGILRAIEFIYKEPGVNRPLNPDDDEHKNLNGTKYRNQINKVANAIKEIIQGLKTEYIKPSAAGDFSKVKEGEKEKVNLRKRLFANQVSKHVKTKWTILVLSLLLLIAVAFGVSRIISGNNNSKGLREKEKSIAVLSFLNFSDDPHQKNISDGLTIEIINHLYKIKSFDKVVSPTSIMTYKGSGKKIPEIARELNVNYILEGTYKKIGDSVRVTAQLIDPVTDNFLWQDEYDKPYKDLISIQAEIALQIAYKIKAYISSSEKENIQKIPTANQEAYELIQRGLFLWNTRGFRSINQLLELTRKAIILDPKYSDAYAFAGLCTILKGSVWGGSEMNSVVAEASSYLDKALESDQNNCTAHLGLALYFDWVKWDYVKAENEFLKIIDLEPNNPLYPELYVEFLLKRRQLEQALNYKVITEQSYRTIQINILSGNIRDSYNSIYKYLDLQGAKGQKYVGDCFLWMGKFDSARIHLESAIAGKDSLMMSPRFQAYHALAYFKTNRSAPANRIIHQLIKRSSITTAGSPEYFTGWYYSGIGETDSAFYWLEKAFKNRSNQLGWLKADPVFKNIRSDSRYPDLYNRTGHKAYDDYIAGLKR